MAAGHAQGPSHQLLAQWFDAIDVDRSGVLTVTELQRALALGGLNYPPSVVAHIIRIHDRDKTGTINFAEFEKLHVFLTTIQTSFGYFDKDASGTLSYDEILEALQHAGYYLDRSVLRTVMERFDPLNTGMLGLPEYLQLALFIRSATATFNAFDVHRTGMIHLNYNQYIYAAANTM